LMILSLVARLTLLLQGLQMIWAGNLRWAWWVSCSIFLGLQIKQSKEGTFVHQAKYTNDIVRKFKMEDSKAWCRWGRWTRRPEGVPKHDQVTSLLDGDEARHPILGMSVCSFSSVSKDFASASG
jgi:hypothetical protein